MDKKTYKNKVSKTERKGTLRHPPSSSLFSWEEEVCAVSGPIIHCSICAQQHSAPSAFSWCLIHFWSSAAISGALLGSKWTCCHFRASPKASRGVRRSSCYLDHTRLPWVSCSVHDPDKSSRQKAWCVLWQADFSGTVKRIQLPVTTECYTQPHLEKHVYTNEWISKWICH